MKLRVPACAVAGFLSLASPALPHHSQTMYDDKKQVTITGTVTKFAWMNPHVWIYLDVPKDGKVEKWEVETNSAATLRRAGWVRDEFKPGETVTIMLWPRKDGTLEGMLGEAHMPSGKVIKVGGNGPQRPR